MASSENEIIKDLRKQFDKVLARKQELAIENEALTEKIEALEKQIKDLIGHVHFYTGRIVGGGE